MATNLLAAGHRLRVWNRSRAPVDELVRKGAATAADPREAFGEVLISMLADDGALREVILASPGARGRGIGPNADAGRELAPGPSAGGDCPG